jgi:hypothetical protein
VTLTQRFAVKLLTAAGNLGNSDNFAELLEVVIKASPEDMYATVNALTTILRHFTDNKAFTRDLLNRPGQIQPQRRITPFCILCA